VGPGEPPGARSAARKAGGGGEAARGRLEGSQRGSGGLAAGRLPCLPASPDAPYAQVSTTGRYGEAEGETAPDGNGLPVCLPALFGLVVAVGERFNDPVAGDR
jgi:hypothetical protein